MQYHAVKLVMLQD